MDSQYQTCLAKQEQIKHLFASCTTEEAKYEKIIAMGRQQSALPAEEKITQNIVKGCQSTVYLSTQMRDGKVFFVAESDALISAGLAAILIQVYSGETPEAILKCPPKYLEELGISTSLTPNRANGLYSIHLRMKQEALQALLKQQQQ